MIKKTLMIFGPGGIGKSPLEQLIKPDAARIDPYRLRPGGPRRDQDDPYYAHPKLRDELHRALKSLGDRCKLLAREPRVEWFPRGKVTFFDVRGEWQCLLLRGLTADLAKAEVYAPAVPILFGQEDIRALFGQLFVVLLNPVEPLRTLSNSSSLKAKTRKNCKLRGDKAASVRKRVKSIDEELPAWRTLLDLEGCNGCSATEYHNWQFPEHSYRDNFKSMLRAARGALIAGNPDLSQFFK